MNKDLADAKKYARVATQKQQNITKYEEITQKAAALRENIGDMQFNLNATVRGWRNRPAPANTLEFNTTQKMLAKMDDFWTVKDSDLTSMVSQIQSKMNI